MLKYENFSHYSFVDHFTFTVYILIWISIIHKVIRPILEIIFHYIKFSLCKGISPPWHQRWAPLISLSFTRDKHVHCRRVTNPKSFTSDLSKASYRMNVKVGCITTKVWTLLSPCTIFFPIGTELALFPDPSALSDLSWWRWGEGGQSRCEGRIRTSHPKWLVSSLALGPARPFHYFLHPLPPCRRPFRPLLHPHPPSRPFLSRGSLQKSGICQQTRFWDFFSDWVITTFF